MNVNGYTETNDSNWREDAGRVLKRILEVLDALREYIWASAKSAFKSIDASKLGEWIREIVRSVRSFIDTVPRNTSPDVILTWLRETASQLGSRADPVVKFLVNAVRSGANYVTEVIVPFLTSFFHSMIDKFPSPENRRAELKARLDSIVNPLLKVLDHDYVKAVVNAMARVSAAFSEFKQHVLDVIKRVSNGEHIDWKEFAKKFQDAKFLKVFTKWLTELQRSVMNVISVAKSNGSSLLDKLYELFDSPSAQVWIQKAKLTRSSIEGAFFALKGLMQAADPSGKKASKVFILTVIQNILKRQFGTVVSKAIVDLLGSIFDALKFDRDGTVSYLPRRSIAFKKVSVTANDIHWSSATDRAYKALMIPRSVCKKLFAQVDAALENSEQGNQVIQRLKGVCNYANSGLRLMISNETNVYSEAMFAYPEEEAFQKGGLLGFRTIDQGFRAAGRNIAYTFGKETYFVHFLLKLQKFAEANGAWAAMSTIDSILHNSGETAADDTKHGSVISEIIFETLHYLKQRPLSVKNVMQAWYWMGESQIYRRFVKRLKVQSHIENFATKDDRMYAMIMLATERSSVRNYANDRIRRMTSVAMQMKGQTVRVNWVDSDPLTYYRSHASLQDLYKRMGSFILIKDTELISKGLQPYTFTSNLLVSGLTKAAHTLLSLFTS